MPIPDYQSLMRPLLAFGSDGSEKNINDAINGIANQLGLTEDERHQLLPSGKQAIFANRVHWARTYLDKAGAIKRTRRSHFVITDRGKQLLTDNPIRIDVRVLKKFPEFVAFQSPKLAGKLETTIHSLLLQTIFKNQRLLPKRQFNKLKRKSLRALEVTC